VGGLRGTKSRGERVRGPLLQVEEAMEDEEEGGEGATLAEATPAGERGGGEEAEVLLPRALTEALNASERENTEPC
jgi:hypothetical protein